MLISPERLNLDSEVKENFFLLFLIYGFLPVVSFGHLTLCTILEIDSQVQ